jgi:hypothetical protein
MGKSICLYSRTMPSNSAAPKRPRGFLALSGELRNHIYQYHFGVIFRCELVAQNHRLHAPTKVNTVKLWAGSFHPTTNPLRYTTQTKGKASAPVVLRISRHLGEYNAVEALKTNWPTSQSALPLTCRQVYSETLVLLYNATVFVCAAPSRLTNFLSTARLAFVTKFELHYKTYGDPRSNRDCVWQDKHNEAWVRACTAASKKLVRSFLYRLWNVFRGGISQLHCTETTKELVFGDVSH